eukprot:GFUD01043893.1.p2 GENE.GFUD01043893.1~~GFUD01043893.1.p2  ORF type:complete len:166 (-),score=60.01 GFUD01043893.1:103-600(-)
MEVGLRDMTPQLAINNMVFLSKGDSDAILQLEAGVVSEDNEDIFDVFTVCGDKAAILQFKTRVVEVEQGDQEVIYHYKVDKDSSSEVHTPAEVKVTFSSIANTNHCPVQVPIPPDYLIKKDANFVCVLETRNQVKHSVVAKVGGQALLLWVQGGANSVSLCGEEN